MHVFRFVLVFYSALLFLAIHEILDFQVILSTIRLWAFHIDEASNLESKVPFVCKCLQTRVLDFLLSTIYVSIGFRGYHTIYTYCYTYTLHICIYIYMCIYIYNIYIYICVYIRICNMYVYEYMYIYIYIHTYNEYCVSHYRLSCSRHFLFIVSYHWPGQAPSARPYWYKQRMAPSWSVKRWMSALLHRKRLRTGNAGNVPRKPRKRRA